MDLTNLYLQEEEGERIIYVSGAKRKGGPQQRTASMPSPYPEAPTNLSLTQGTF